MEKLAFFLISFILSLILTPLVRVFALKNGLISYPRAERWHKQPTAILGGVSIYLAAIITFILIGISSKAVWGLFIGSTFIFLAGFIDDKFKLTPYVKLFTQIIAGCIAIFFGVSINLPLNFLSIPVTLIWIIAITNAFNLLDNIDGLASGIAVISTIMLFVSSPVFLNNSLAVFALAISGSALGFLPYNFNPAKIFMGDSGSMFLGYSIAVISISGTARHLSSLLITMFIPVLILSVPIFDTLFVMIIRRIQGKRLFEGGKDHTSHHLVTLGLTPRKTVLLLYAISIVFGFIGVLYTRWNILFVSGIAILGTMVLMFFGLFLFERTNYNSLKLNKKPLNNNKKTFLNVIFLHKRRMIEVILDFALICIAYYSAYFLRFEGSVLLATNLQLLQESLLWIIIIKMTVFFVFGLYRGVWRHVGISDFFTIFKVVSLGSVLSVLVLTFLYRFQDYSRAVFFIDWLVLLFLILGSRFMFRILGEFINHLQNPGGKKVLIFGAGDIGEMVIREIKRNRLLNYTPVGFIDDDPHKKGSKINGIPVLGSREIMKDIILERGIMEIIIAISDMQTDELDTIIGICKECGISYRRIKGILDG